MANNKKKRKNSNYNYRQQVEEAVAATKAEGLYCVNCGKFFENGHAPLEVRAISRDFPVCSEECKAATERYVENDKKYKTVLYLIMFFAAIGIFIGALFSENPKIYCPCVMAVGLAFIMFPYPISSFETFLNHSIKKITLLTRTLGVIILGAGTFFLINSIENLNGC